ncbi:MAG: hypothetical protein EPN68_06440 [Rhodanobacter sp.]|nr:MAG: hypothetical protein EPN68_06440 [Rhodanobacter sp.]
MWYELARFTLRRQFRSKGFWALGLACLISGWFLTLYPNTIYVPPAGKVSAPINMMALVSMISNFVAVFSVPLLVGPFLQDWERRFSGMLFSSSITPGAYFCGRFLAAMAVLLSFVLATMLGAVMAFYVPWTHADHGGGIAFKACLWSFALFGVPNALFATSAFLGLAVWKRNIKAIYTGVVLIWLFWVITGVFGSSPVGQMMDPFGARVLYRTIVFTHSRTELASLFPVVTHMLALNRLLWLTVSVTISLAAWARFKASYARANTTEGAVGRTGGFAFTATQRMVGANTFLELVAFHVRFVVANVYGATCLSLALLLLYSDLSAVSDPFSIGSFPVTGALLDATSDNFQMVLAVLVVVFTGELVHRDAALRFDGIAMSLPVKDETRIGAQVTALCVAVLCWQLVGAIFCLAYGILGDGQIAVLDFMAGVLAQSVPLCFLAIVAVGFQYAVGNKYVGVGLTALFAIVQKIQFRDVPISPLIRLAGAPALHYSELVRFGDQWSRWFGYARYGLIATLACFLLLLLAGTHRASSRLFSVNRAALRPSLWIGGLFCGLGAVALGLLLYARDPLARPAKLVEDAKRSSEAYWRSYARVAAAGQPDLHHVDMQIRYVPGQSLVDAQGVIQLINQTKRPLRRVLFSAAPDVQAMHLTVKEQSFDLVGSGTFLLSLTSALMPGETLDVPFHSVWKSSPYDSAGGLGAVQPEYAFLSSDQLLPCIGLNNQMEEEGLAGEPEQVTLPHASMQQKAAQSILGCGRNAATMRAELISTPAFKVVASGDLKTTRIQDGQLHAVFEVNTPAPVMWAFGWGAWTEQSKVVGGVRVRVLAAHPHQGNASLLLDTAVHALSLYSTLYGPYRYSSYSIVEVPRFTSDAESFVGLAALPETVGFTTDYRGSASTFSLHLAAFNQPHWIVAHEVSHQWWGLQLLPGNAPGWQFLTEGLAEYSAWREYQNDKLPDLLTSHRRALLMYLAGRSQYHGRERSLVEVMNDPAVAYAKGLLAMMNAQQILGSDHMDEVLGQWFRFNAALAPSQIRATALMDAIAERAPAEDKPYVTDLFSSTRVMHGSIEWAQSRSQSDGTWITTACVKMKASPEIETRFFKVPLSLAATQSDPAQPLGKPVELHRQRLIVPLGRTRVTFTTRGRPDEVQLDPDLLLLDTNRDGHSRSVRDESSKQACTR